MTDTTTYDVIVVGGGLAGLSSAILLARKGHKVLLLEKESYPKHKVCGEYISMESKPFLQSLGIAIDDMNLPVINRLQVTDAKGNELTTQMPQGGFGISRYMLDAALASLAEAAGVTLFTKTRADNVQWEQDAFSVTTKDKVFISKVVCGTWGKRSNIDVKWQRSFITEKNAALNNYVGIKYHINYPWPADTVGLHNFPGGYCGISPVEENKSCLCYLTTAANLHQCGNDIKKMEKEILMQNPWLHRIFSESEFLYASPLAISQISFEKKEQVQDHVLLLGDAAGMITPLCGNGMSMALHAAKIAAQLADSFLKGNISRADMESSYAAQWKKIFSTRVMVGRMVQSNFGKGSATALFIKAAKNIPMLRKALISTTAGKPF